MAHGGFEGGDVRNILLAPSRALVREQRLETDDGDTSPVELERIAGGARLVERDPARPIQDVDAARRQRLRPTKRHGISARE